MLERKAFGALTDSANHGSCCYILLLLVLLVLFLMLAPDVSPDVAPVADDAIDATPDHDAAPAAGDAAPGDDSDECANGSAASPLLLSVRVVWLVSKRWAPCCAPWRSG